MDDLISRSAVLQALAELKYTPAAPSVFLSMVGQEIHNTAIDSAMGVIEDFDTIDAEPVRHGRWTLIEGFVGCSECGASPADWEVKPDNPLGVPPFCHSCGAKMDGEAP